MNIPSPRDARGTCIPRDTTMMYRNDNSQFHVTDFFYEAKPDKWFARSGSECIKVDELYLEIKQEDSIDQLAADLDRLVNDQKISACTYLNRDERKCNGCKFQKNSWDSSGHKNCTKPFLHDVAARVHRLAGDAE